MNLPKSRSPAEREKFRQAALRKQGRGDKDPTPEGIRQGCLEAQAEWTEDERQRRVVGGRNADVTVMETRFSFEE